MHVTVDDIIFVTTTECVYLKLKSHTTAAPKLFYELKGLCRLKHDY